MSANRIVQPTRGPAGYAGFRATIKAVATGPRGSRDLTFDEAREATAALLDGAVSPAQAGAFLIGMRVKGEPPRSWPASRRRCATAPRDCALAARRRRPARRQLRRVRRRRRRAGARARRVRAAAAAGAAVVTACGDRLGPKHGVTPADVLAALGGPRGRPPGVRGDARPPSRSSTPARRCPAAGSRRCATRSRRLRGPVHSAEKLVDWFGARRFVVGHTHGSYAGRLLGALEVLGAERAIAVRGIEGSDVLRPGRPAAVGPGGAARAARAARAPPARRRGPGDERRADPRGARRRRRRRGAARGRGERRGPAVAAGAAPDPSAALRRAEAALDEGGAIAALDALVG